MLVVKTGCNTKTKVKVKGRVRYVLFVVQECTKLRSAVSNLAYLVYLLGKTLAGHWDDPVPQSNRGRNAARKTKALRQPQYSKSEGGEDDSKDESGGEEDEVETLKRKKEQEKKDKRGVAHVFLRIPDFHFQDPDRRKYKNNSIILG